MVKLLFRDNRGQAAAEFGVALIVLMPLIFWMLRFAELLNEKHKTIEASRFAVWEKAYGREEGQIKSTITDMLKKASLFSPQSEVSVSVDIDSKTTENDFLSFHPLPVVGNMPHSLGLEQNNHYVSKITLNDKLPLGISYSMKSSCGLIANPWNLTDRNNNGKIDNKDLAKAVNGIYFWPASPIITPILDIASELQNNSFVKKLVSWLDQSLDIDPRGHPKLEYVPKPEE